MPAAEESVTPRLRGERCGRGASPVRGVTPGTPNPKRLPAACESWLRVEEEEDMRGVDVASGRLPGQLSGSEEESKMVTSESV